MTEQEIADRDAWRADILDTPWARESRAARARVVRLAFVTVWLAMTLAAWVSVAYLTH